MDKKNLTLLVTRPYRASIAAAQELITLGIHPIIEPLIAYRSLPLSESTLPAHCQGIIFTSQHAVEAFLNHFLIPDIPVWVVGPQTEKVVRQKGIQRVWVGAGNGEQLCQKIKNDVNPQKGPLIYASGRVTSGNIQRWLQAQGYEVYQYVVYETTYSQTFTPRTQDLLFRQRLHGVVLCSAETARTFTRIMQHLNQKRLVTSLTAFCMSHAIAAPIQEMPWRHIHISEEPTWPSLVQRILRIRDDQGHFFYF